MSDLLEKFWLINCNFWSCDKYSEDVGLMTNVEDGIGVFL